MYEYHVKGLSVGVMDQRGFMASVLGRSGSDFKKIYARFVFDPTPDHVENKFVKEPIEKRVCKRSKVNLAIMFKEYYYMME